MRRFFRLEALKPGAEFVKTIQHPDRRSAFDQPGGQLALLVDQHWKGERFRTGRRRQDRQKFRTRFYIGPILPGKVT